MKTNAINILSTIKLYLYSPFSYLIAVSRTKAKLKKKKVKCLSRIAASFYVPQMLPKSN